MYKEQRHDIQRHRNVISLCLSTITETDANEWNFPQPACIYARMYLVIDLSFMLFYIPVLHFFRCYSKLRQAYGKTSRRPLTRN
jgi:hypothetical protein